MNPTEPRPSVDPEALLAHFDELAMLGEGAPQFLEWVNGLSKDSLHALALALGKRGLGAWQKREAPAGLATPGANHQPERRVTWINVTPK